MVIQVGLASIFLCTWFLPETNGTRVKNVTEINEATRGGAMDFLQNLCQEASFDLGLTEGQSRKGTFLSNDNTRRGVFKTSVAYGD